MQTSPPLTQRGPTWRTRDTVGVSRQSSRCPQDRVRRYDRPEQAPATFRDVRVADVSRSIFVNTPGPVNLYPEGAPSTRPPENCAVGARVIIHPTHDYNSTVATPGPFQEHPESEVYYKHLLVKKRGTPLWVPGSPMMLPTEYRRNGASIGDVGIINPTTGQFSFLFNIFLPADHEINVGRVPNGFIPLDMSMARSSIAHSVVYDRGSYLASSSLRRTHSSDFSFETTRREGAILVMPDGALTEDLENYKLVEKYIATNAKSWWERIESDEWGRKTENGIQIVVGMDKVSSWGMATYENIEEPMQFELISEDDMTALQGRNYKWRGVNGRTGPPDDEIRDLLTGPNSSPLRNQCVFVRTLNVSVSSKVRGESAVHEVQSSLLGDIQTSKGVPVISRPLLRSAKRVCNLERQQVSHPSKALNKYLFEKCPNADVVITKDSDWISVITENDTTMPCLEDICARVLGSHTICETRGVVTLTPRTNVLEPISHRNIATTSEDVEMIFGQNDTNNQPDSGDLQKLEEENIELQFPQWILAAHVSSVFNIPGASPSTPLGNLFEMLTTWGSSHLFSQTSHHLASPAHLPADQIFPQIHNVFGDLSAFSSSTSSTRRVSRVSSNNILDPQFEAKKIVYKILAESSSKDKAFAKVNERAREIKSNLIRSVFDEASQRRVKSTHASQQRAQVRRSRPPTFLCILCESQFTTKNNLQNHYRSHLRMDQYRCPRCGDFFRGEGILRRHTDGAHKCRRRDGS